MDKSAMFKGLNKEEWTQALSEQNKYLKDRYGYDMLQTREIQTEQLNKQALEAQQFNYHICYNLDIHFALSFA